MNKYGQPLKASISQTLLPVLTRDGRVHGWFPITAHTFDGTETTYNVPDSSSAGHITLPITTVTTDSGNGVGQYMAALFPVGGQGKASNYKPWASSSLVPADQGYFRWYQMPAETWVLNFGLGTLLTAMSTRMNLTVAPATNPGAPGVTTPAAITWQASVEYESLLGDCEFFDFNWITLFAATTCTAAPLRIVVTSNPAPIAPATVPPMVASVIGKPQATVNGVVYDSIRIMKLADLIPGAYAFTFNVYDVLGQVTAVTLNLTVA